MKTKLIIANCLGLLTLLLLNGTSLGNAGDVTLPDTDIRGRVISVVQGRTMAVPGARVDIYREETKVATTYTDAKGFYFVSNLAPGSYTVRVNEKNYQISVAPPEPERQFQDVPPIKLN